LKLQIESLKKESRDKESKIQEAHLRQQETVQALSNELARL